MVAAARAALLGAVLVPRLSAETIQEHLLELGKQSFEVRSQEWVTSTLDDDVFGDNFGTNPDFSYDDPRNYPVSRDFEMPQHLSFTLQHIDLDRGNSIEGAEDATVVEG